MSKDNVDKIERIITIELERNKKSYTSDSLIAELLDGYMKAKNYFNTVSKETITSFNQMKAIHLESKRK